MTSCAGSLLLEQGFGFWVKKVLSQDFTRPVLGSEPLLLIPVLESGLELGWIRKGRVFLPSFTLSVCRAGLCFIDFLAKFVGWKTEEEGEEEDVEEKGGDGRIAWICSLGICMAKYQSVSGN